MAIPAHLFTESSFHASYLVSDWLDAFGGTPDRSGVLVRRDPMTVDLARRLRDFHGEHAGARTLPAAALAEAEALYGPFSETEHAMVALYGVPRRSYAHARDPVMTGRSPNNEAMRDWLASACAARRPYLFLFLDRILAPWWIDTTGGRAVNAHSAVLPYARGMFALEQLAARADAARFERGAGATVHYIDNGVDTGPVITARRLARVFEDHSVWECKARAFRLAFTLLIEAAAALTAEGAPSYPAAVPPARAADGEEFRSAGFTPERRRAAERGFLLMQRAARETRPGPGRAEHPAAAAGEPVR